MINDLLIAPEQRIEGIRFPLIFLAGPIQGASDWQRQAINYIAIDEKAVSIANPRRKSDSKIKGDYGDAVYDEQVDWETKHLNLAGIDGVVFFWLAKEQTHNLRRAYAQTSRAELFEWKMKHQYRGAKVIVGIEKGFTGERYIRRRFSQDCPEVKILTNLEETCADAVKLAYSNR